jgi:hypothetical protein
MIKLIKSLILKAVFLPMLPVLAIIDYLLWNMVLAPNFTITPAESVLLTWERWRSL